MMNTCFHFYLHLTNMVSSEHLQITNSSYTEVALKKNTQNWKNNIFRYPLPPSILPPSTCYKTIWCKICKQHSEKHFEILTRKRLRSSNLLECGTELHLPPVILPLWFPRLSLQLGESSHKRNLPRRGVFLCVCVLPRHHSPLCFSAVLLCDHIKRIAGFFRMRLPATNIFKGLQIMLPCT